MNLFRVFRFGLVLVSTSLVLSSAINAKDIVSGDQEAWLKSINEAWAAEDSEFKNSPTSPLAGTSRFEISETATAYFAENEGKLEWSPEQVGHPVFSLTMRGDQWAWEGLDKHTSLGREDKDLPSGSVLAAGDNSKARRFTVEFYPSEGKITALVFDPDTQRIQEFEALDRFDPNPKFVTNARITRFETPKQLDLITARQRFKKQYRYAKLAFEIDGAELELTAYKHALEGEGSQYLFIPFTDKTTGKYSYGGGRYLVIEEARDSDEILIDFNLVTNPLCSYAPIYNCIVPTRENKLPIAILAGVKKYH